MMTTSLKHRSAAWKWAAESFGAGLFLAYAVVLLAHRAAPSLTDYANWVYQGALLHGHLTGMTDAAHRLKSYPVPNSAATLGIGLLCFLLPWKWAADGWLCLQLLTSWAVTRHALRTTRGSAWLWVIVPVVTYLGVNFWYGFVNFQLGLCWVVLAGSILLRAAQSGRLAAPWRVGALLVLAFFTHMIPLAFCCLTVVLYAAQVRVPRVLWQLVPAGLLSAWYVAGRFLLERNADGQAGMVATVRTFSGAFWAYKVNSYLKSFGFVNPLEQDGRLVGQAGLVVLLLGNLLLAALLGWALVVSARRAFQQRAPERFLWAAVLAILPLYLLAPGAALGVSDPGSRLLQAGLAIAVLLCGAEMERLLRAAAVPALVLGLAGLYLFQTTGFAPADGAPTGTLPARVVQFNHVPNNDQDYFYQALREGRRDVPVFPTGMFLTR